MSIFIFTALDFKHCCRISNIHQKVKMQTAFLWQLRHGYVIRLAHIFVAATATIDQTHATSLPLT